MPSKKTVTIATHLAATPNRVWEEVNKPRLLFFVAHPMIQFKPVDPPEIPECLEDGEYVVRMSWYGIVPLGRQIIDVSRPAPKGDVRFLRDNGRSAFIRRWDHLISVAPDGAGTLYTDRVEIDAGVGTPIIAAFARRFYSHRQKRWRRLVKANFDYTRA